MGRQPLVDDLALLWWLRWKQLRHSIDYWLGAIGYDVYDRTISNRLYGVYLAIFLGLWLLLMWSFAVYETMQIGARLSPSQSDTLRSSVSELLPWLVLGAAIVLAMRALRATPLVLSEVDLAYIAGSPVHRGMVVLIEFARRCWKVTLLIVPLATLVAVMLAHRVSRDEVGLSVIPAALVAVPVVGFVWSAGWLAGMVRLGHPAIIRFPMIWLAPSIFVAPAVAVPGIATWPGSVLASALLGHPAAGAALGVAALAAALVAAVIYAGRQASMIVVGVESATAFRMPTLISVGGLATTPRMEAPRAPSRQRVAVDGRPLIGLPDATGLRMLLIRGALVTFRKPWTLLWTLLGGGAFAVSGALLVDRGASAQIWLVWLTAVIMRPPRGLVATFAGDQEAPFLRQFLPVDNLTLLAADSAMPFVLLLTAIIAGWVALDPFYSVSGWILGVSIVLAFLLLLSQAAVPARAATWDPALASLVFGGLGFGVVLLVAEIVDPAAAVIVAVCVALLLAALIRGGRRVTAVQTS